MSHEAILGQGLPVPGLPALRSVVTSRRALRVARFLAVGFVIGPILMLALPWRQNLAVSGRVVAFAPLDRQQVVKAPVSGRVVRWTVQEGSRVAEGDLLLEIADIDPQLLDRLEDEKRAIEGQLEAYRTAITAYAAQVENHILNRDLQESAARFRLETQRDRIRAAEQNRDAASAAHAAADLQLARMKNLLPQGIVAQRDYDVALRDYELARTALASAEAALNAARNDAQAIEKDLERISAEAQIKIDSTNASLGDTRAKAHDAEQKLAKIRVQISRQQAQQVLAPREGTVLRLEAFQGGEIVKAGDNLLTLVPDAEDRAVELWMDGRDAPLVTPGSPVRLQFEGWPAVQFAGWPSVAVGTFGGTVAFVDSADDGKGRFRIMVTPDEADPQAWPSTRFLRQGARAKGWVLLNEVSIGFEIWRQLNGFPPVVSTEEPAEDVARKRIK